uniref:Uncharacterized protein n=1 Tax=Arundo donax TaxID=35708 RepID=A0A0A9HPT1_ARUDO
MEDLDHSQAQQVLGAIFGPEKATPLNTYAMMKSGIKSVDSNGSSGPISSRTAQKCMDDYIAGVKRARRVVHLEDDDGDNDEMEEEEQDQEQEKELNAHVLYNVSGGTPHGRLAIVNGAVRAADVRAAAKETNVQPSN